MTPQIKLYYPTFPPKRPACKVSPDGRHQFTPPQVECDYCGYGGVVVGNQVLYVPTDKGLIYHQREEANVLLYGSRGSAKSTTGRWDAHLRALAYPGYKYIILRRTMTQLQKSHLSPTLLPREMQLLGGSFNSTSKIAKYPNGSVGYFSHCENEDDVLNLLSAEFYLAFFDELSTFEWDWFTKLSASVRVPDGSGLVALVRAATNPYGASAQKVDEYFVAKSVDLEEDPDYDPNDWFAIQANMDDNAYLDLDQYRKRFSGLQRGSAIRKAWVEGEFSVENALFDFHANRQGKPWHVTNDIDLKKILKHATIYRAIDSGWYPDPTVVLWIAHLGNRHIVFNEVVEFKKTAAQMAEIIKNEDERLGIKKVALTFCDPSMDINTTADVKTIMEIYEANGIPMEPSVNNRETMAIVMHNVLAEQADENTPRIQFYNYGPRGCPYLVRTIPQMRFDSKKPSRMADHKDDHAVVACCYYLMSHTADVRTQSVELTKLRPWMKTKNHGFILGSDQIRNTPSE